MQIYKTHNHLIISQLYLNANYTLICFITGDSNTIITVFQSIL